MKIVIAPDKFKGCLTAAQAADAIAEGVRRADPSIEIDICPMADGGEGTVAAMVAATGGRIVTQKVTGPLPRMKVDAPIGLLGGEQTAVIEMAAASGMALLAPDQRDPARTTTYGTGELMRAAADLGAKRIILGIGGSATIDGGVGAAQAWGAKFTLISGQSYTFGDRRLSGADLERLLRVQGNLKPQRDVLLLENKSNGDDKPTTALTTALKRSSGRKSASHAPDLGSLRLDTRGIEFIVACDVGNPLLGPNGAARIFGPQKGATPGQIQTLESGLRALVERTGCHEQAESPGAGAAGGLGFGMLVFFGATLKPGIEIVLDATKLKDRLAGAELCITGEGRLDAQTVQGKTVCGVSRACRDRSVPCVALAGTIGEGAEQCYGEGLTSFFPILDGPMTLADAMLRAPELLSRAAENLVRSMRKLK